MLIGSNWKIMFVKIIGYTILMIALLISSVGLSHAQYQPSYDQAGSHQYEKNFLNNNITYFGENEEQKTVSSARMYSILATVVPTVITTAYFSETRSADQSLGGIFVGGLGLTGALVGPSAGSLYAGQMNSFRRGVALRFLSLATIFIGAGYTIKGNPDRFGQVTIAVGTIGLIGRSIYDIFWVSRSAVREHNEATSQQIKVAPWVSKGNEAAGLSLQIGI